MQPALQPDDTAAQDFLDAQKRRTGFGRIIDGSLYVHEAQVVSILEAFSASQNATLLNQLSHLQQVLENSQASPHTNLGDWIDVAEKCRKLEQDVQRLNEDLTHKSNSNKSLAEEVVRLLHLNEQLQLAKEGYKEQLMKLGELRQ